MEPAKDSEVAKEEVKGADPVVVEEKKDEKASAEPVVPKHSRLNEDAMKETTEVELIDNKFTKNVTSPFISSSKVWEDSEIFGIPEDILNNIVVELGFKKPSIIQSVAIPMISKEPYNALIAQARNGAGKTGSFSIGSTLRVNRDDPRTQVLVIVHTRELCNQIASVYNKIIKGTGITFANFTEDSKPAQIVVATHGKIEAQVSGRKQLDLSGLKCLVVDEADVFFLDEKNYGCLLKIANSKHIKDNEKVQWVLFSATYPVEDQHIYERVQERVSKIISKAQQIKIKAEKLKLPNVQQFMMKCAEGKKLDFIKEIFETCEMTQTFIFVNTKAYALKVHKLLRAANFASYLMFSDMSNEERDSTIEKFRDGKISVLITTNMLARGIDVLETQLVINYDVPTCGGREKIADPETYLHRIGRTGRFGSNGVALTIYDRPVDKDYMDQIIAHYDMKSAIQELDGPDHLKETLRMLQD